MTEFEKHILHMTKNVLTTLALVIEMHHDDKAKLMDCCKVLRETGADLVKLAETSK